MAQRIEEAFAVVAGGRIARSAEEAKPLRLLGPDDVIDDYRRELDANAMSPHQFEVCSRVARVLCGADRAGTERTEADLLEPERMHFVALAGDALTQARIAHLRKTGEVLRN
jgi:hypothetical protein